MKKLVIFLVAFSCCFVVFGKDGVYINPEDADLYDFELESRTYTISGKLEKGTEVNLDFQNVQKSHNGKYLLLIKHSDHFDDVFSDEIIPKNTDDLIPSEFKTQENDEHVWIGEYYMDVVKNCNREILREHRPAAIKKWGEPGEDYFDWYTYILGYNMVSNCVIELDLSQFFIENINIIENGFKIETDKYKLDEDMLSKSNINMAEPHTLYFIYDGDTANVFVDDLNTKLYSMVKIKKTDYEKLENFIQRKTNLIQDFNFPRHADGSCDYANGNATSAASENQGIEEAENAPATERAESAEEAASFPEAAEIENSNDEAADAGAKQNAALPILPIAAGGAVLTILLAAILLAVKKKKGEKK